MSGIYFKKGNSFSKVNIYKKTEDGIVLCPVYRKTSNGMERIDLNDGSNENINGGGIITPPSIPSNSVVVKGYASWCGSYRSASSTGTFTDNFNDDRRDRIYQGYYPNFNYLGIISFKDVFKEVRNLNGTITSVKLKLTNTHSYYYAGLNTYICGASNLSTTRPTSFSTDNIDEIKLSDKINFSKGGTQIITLNNTAIQKIQNGSINGFRLLSPTGNTVTDYGYFSGTGTTRPYIEITVTV